MNITLIQPTETKMVTESTAAARPALFYGRCCLLHTVAIILQLISIGIKSF